MLPTLNTFGDIIAIERISVHLLKAGYNNPNGYLPCISLGDLVVSVSPLNSRKHVCKRVLGLVSSNLSLSTLAHLPMTAR
jgi:signal peptidase I